jgi:hypothetical protein
MTNEPQQGVNGAETTTAVTAPRAITPKGQRLPQATFAEVQPLVEALAGLNGPASRNLIFSQAGKAGTGGVADRRWAAMGYYGFRAAAGGHKHVITDRGRAFISDDADAAAHARQDGVMDTGFRRIVRRFSSRPVNVAAIAGLLHEDLGVPHDRSKALAALLITIATEAGLIADDVFQVAPIERAMDTVSEPADVAAGSKPSPSSTTASPTPKPAAPAKQPKVAPAPPPVAEAIHEGEGQSGPFEVSLEIKVEAQHHTPREIGLIVQEVREALTARAD